MNAAENASRFCILFSPVKPGTAVVCETNLGPFGFLMIILNACFAPPPPQVLWPAYPNQSSVFPSTRFISTGAAKLDPTLEG